MAPTEKMNWNPYAWSGVGTDFLASRMWTTVTCAGLIARSVKDSGDRLATLGCRLAEQGEELGDDQRETPEG